MFMKSEKKGIWRIIAATGYSLQGLQAAWKGEAAFRQEVFLALVATVIAIVLPVSTLERILMIFAVSLVLIVELLNSAIEAVVDRFGGEIHELSGRAKDVGSAAVLVTLCLAVFVWLAILI